MNLNKQSSDCSLCLPLILELIQLIPHQVLLLTIQTLILTVAYIALYINYLLLKSQVESLAAKY
jgi:hypothetical protein